MTRSTARQPIGHKMSLTVLRCRAGMPARAGAGR
jgi:hypothetical protein